MRLRPRLRDGGAVLGRNPPQTPEEGLGAIRADVHEELCLVMRSPVAYQRGLRRGIALQAFVGGHETVMAFNRALQ